MLSYNEARNLIDREFEKLQLQSEEVDINDCLNRTLAEDVVADINLPPFDNSAVDGIAINFDEEIKSWKIKGEISAGNYSHIELLKDEAVLIMTGAKVPTNCNTVIPLEDYTIERNTAVLKNETKFKKGINIRPKASDIAFGEVALKKHKVLTPNGIAALATCGKSKVKVLKKLQISILATGDELVPIEVKPSADKIRVSNSYGLTNSIKALHQNPISLGFVGDDRNILKEVISKALNSDNDILITTGGVSVGKYDYLKEIFEELGANEIFWKANIKPGKPAYFAKISKGNKTILIFGLPGNPVSCMVNFDVYLKANIEKIYNLNGSEIVHAKLLNDVRKKDGKRHFVRGILTKTESGQYQVTSQSSQSSGNLVGFSNSNCLIEIDEKTINPTKGNTVKCIKM